MFKKGRRRKEVQEISKEELEEQTKEFLKKGGKITKIDSLELEAERLIAKALATGG